MDGANICREDVFRLARLARLEIDADEAQAMTDDLSRILATFEALLEIELPDESDEIAATALREDQQRPAAERDDVTLESLTRHLERGHVLVPKVIR